MEYEGLEFADPDTPMSRLERKIKEEQQKTLDDYVMSHLTETHRRKIQ